MPKIQLSVRIRRETFNQLVTVSKDMERSPYSFAGDLLDEWANDRENPAPASVCLVPGETVSIPGPLQASPAPFSQLPDLDPLLQEIAVPDGGGARAQTLGGLILDAKLTGTQLFIRSRPEPLLVKALGRLLPPLHQAAAARGWTIVIEEVIP